MILLCGLSPYWNAQRRRGSYLGPRCRVQGELSGAFGLVPQLDCHGKNATITARCQKQAGVLTLQTGTNNNVKRPVRDIPVDVKINHIRHTPQPSQPSHQVWPALPIQYRTPLASSCSFQPASSFNFKVRVPERRQGIDRMVRVTHQTLPPCSKSAPRLPVSLQPTSSIHLPQ